MANLIYDTLTPLEHHKAYLERVDCFICGQKLRNLPEHIRICHKTVCHLCNKQFETEEEKNSHFNQEHRSKKRPPNLSCVLCDNTWKTAWNHSFKNHIRSIHKGIYHRVPQIVPAYNYLDSK